MNQDLNKKKARNEFIVLTLLTLLTRLFDLTSTYLLTPDLKYESNPLITSFSINWQGFILIQLFVSILVIWTNYYSLFKTKIEYPRERGLSFNEFQMYYMFGRGVQASTIIGKLLGLIKVNLAFIGYLLPRVLILFSSVIILIHSMLYNGILIPPTYIYVLYGCLLFSVVLFNKLYLRKHYTIYKVK